MNDHIQVRNLALTASLCESGWTSRRANGTPILQPVLFSLDVYLDASAAGQSDDLAASVNYSDLCKAVQKACRDVEPLLETTSPSCLTASSSSPTPSRPPIDAYNLAAHVIEKCLASLSNAPTLIERIALDMHLPKAVLRAKFAGVKITRTATPGIDRGAEASSSRSITSFLIGELHAYTIVGVNEHEREERQPVVISLEFALGEGSAADSHASFGFEFARIERSVLEFIEVSAYLTIEALATAVIQKCFSLLENPKMYTITVHLAKPKAIIMAEAPSVTITRKFSDFASLRRTILDVEDSGKVYATLALGSNLGDRFQNIEIALRYLENINALFPHDEAPQGTIEVVESSFLYETAPMYVSDQPAFINCACAVETTLLASELLRVCKAIEQAVDRVPTIRFGPRTVDLDIITYGERVIDSRPEDDRKSLDNLQGHLVVPHPRMSEREFVLRPLADIIPEWIHPRLHLSIRSLLSKVVRRKSANDPPMHKALPFPAPKFLHPLGSLDTPATLTYWVIADPNQQFESHSPTAPRRTYTMATLNVTPDSFSDGGMHTMPEAALKYVREAIASGADIVDVGGYSTRPGAEFVSTEEETRRIVSFLHAFTDAAKNEPELSSVLISVDTFRPEVMLAAVEAGAHCLNDVTALSGPDYPSTSRERFERMRAVARKWRLPSVLMHSRGPAHSNKDYSVYPSVLEGVRAELGAQVQSAVRGKGAMRQWQVIVDPGLGFSKTVAGNVELLRCARALTLQEPVEVASQGTKCGPEGPFAAAAAAPYATPNWNPLAGYPQLIGTSRKSFLGELLSRPLAPINPSAAVAVAPTASESETGKHARPAAERDFATAAAVVCAVQQGVAIVRVHEVPGMVDVVKIANAIWS